MRIEQGIEGAAQPLPLTRERLLSLHQLGHVVVHPHDAHDPSLPIEEPARRGLDVSHGSVGPQHPEPDGVLLLTAHGRLQGALRKRAVLRMHRPRPGLQRTGELFGRHAIQLIHHRIPGQHVMHRIPVPDAHHPGGGGSLEVLRLGDDSGDVVEFQQHMHHAARGIAEVAEAHNPPGLLPIHPLKPHAHAVAIAVTAQQRLQRGMVHRPAGFGIL